jgi:hypothetical protein
MEEWSECFYGRLECLSSCGIKSTSREDVAWVPAQVEDSVEARFEGEMTSNCRYDRHILGGYGKKHGARGTVAQAAWLKEEMYGLSFLGGDFSGNQDTLTSRVSGSDQDLHGGRTRVVAPVERSQHSSHLVALRGPRAPSPKLANWTRHD